MLTQTAVVEKSPVSRVRRWNRTTRQYEWHVVTQEMIEANKRREQYCREFNPCMIEGWV